MAAIVKRLHFRPYSHSYARPHPYPLRHFSSSSDPDSRPDVPQSDSTPAPAAQDRPLFSSFSGLRDKLESRQQNRRQINRTPPASGASSTDEIHRHLSEFRMSSDAPRPSPTAVSLQELYEKNVPEGKESANPSFGRSSMFQPNTSDFLSRMAENPRQKTDADSNQDSRKEGIMSSLGIGFSKAYEQRDLGKKLKELRPTNRKGRWFSLQELSDRLAKVKEAEKKGMGTLSLIKASIKLLDQQKDQKLPMNLGYLGILGGTQVYDLSPPKTELVEKYFHPGDMSFAEKLKLELKKVRDEFKMSESDCGSARVQVAQLTAKITHLSSVLQKKDKHSQRGLQAMIQRRKKLLKYLRRTDWDSYILVLSKFGFRDNQDIKSRYAPRPKEDNKKNNKKKAGHATKRGKKLII